MLFSPSPDVGVKARSLWGCSSPKPFPRIANLSAILAALCFLTLGGPKVIETDTLLLLTSVSSVKYNSLHLNRGSYWRYLRSDDLPWAFGYPLDVELGNWNSLTPTNLPWLCSSSGNFVYVDIRTSSSPWTPLNVTLTGCNLFLTFSIITIFLWHTLSTKLSVLFLGLIMTISSRTFFFFLYDCRQHMVFLKAILWSYLRFWMDWISI